MSLALLERLAAAVGAPFDRSAALVALRATMDSEQSADADAVEDHLVAAGAQIGLRLRLLRGGPAEVHRWLDHTECMAAQSRDGDRAQWLLLEKAGQRFRLTNPETKNSAVVAPDKLSDQLHFADGRGHFLMAEVALPLGRGGGGGGNEGHSGHGGDGHAHPSPFARLVSLLRTEKRDLGVILVFAIFVGLFTLTTPIAVEALVNTVAFGGLMQPLIVLTILLFAFLAFSSVVRGMQTYVVELIQRRIFVRVVAELAHRLPRVSTAGMDGHHGPELVNRFFDVITIQKVIALLLSDGISILLQAVIGMLVLAFYHPALLAFDVLLILAICVVIFGFGIGALRTSIEESKAKYGVADWLQQLAGAPSVFRMAGGEELARDRADHLAAVYVQNRQRHFRVVMTQVVGALTLQALAATALLALGGWLVIAGQLTLGQLVAAELIVSAIVGSMAKAGKHLEAYYDLLTSLDKVGHLFDLPAVSDDGHHVIDAAPASIQGQQVLYQFHGRDAFVPVSFQVEAGERVALTGPAGSGKSTLLEVLAGWRTVAGGRLELNRRDLRLLHPDCVREQVLLLARADIFSGSIAANVHAHRPGVTANDVRESLQAVGLLEEVMQLPDTLNTRVAQDGSPLSGSQMVRLALARALCARPRLLMLDEVLDTLSGSALEAVLAGLFAQKRDMTLIIVSAREDIRSRCDRTWELHRPAPSH